jgi:hypothetical protein
MKIGDTIHHPIFGECIFNHEKSNKKGIFHPIK